MSDQTKQSVWNIGLDAWIIQDGNYSDFEVGQAAEFAVELYRNRSDVISDSTDPISTSLQVGSTYEVVAGKVLQTQDLTVLDIGFLVYREYDREDESNLQGERFRTKIHLGIDPFFYFETLFKIPDVPPLIYSWRVESILRQTAPFIETRSPGKPTILSRDKTRLAYEEIQSTKAWEDDQGHAEYILQCRLLPLAPKRRKSRT